MPLPSDLEGLIRDQGVTSALEELPPAFNQAYNREFRAIGGEFARVFTKERLGPGGIEVRRKGGKRSRDPRGPALPQKMRLSGFTGIVEGFESLEAKRMTIRTSNPVMLAHEYGGTIRPDRGLLKVRFPNAKKVSDADRNDAFIINVRGKPYVVTQVRRGEGVYTLEFLAHLERQVVMKAKLGFRETWARFAPRLMERIGNAAAATLRRLSGKPKNL